MLTLQIMKPLFIYMQSSQAFPMVKLCIYHSLPQFSVLFNMLYHTLLGFTITVP